MAQSVRCSDIAFGDPRGVGEKARPRRQPGFLLIFGVPSRFLSTSGGHWANISQVTIEPTECCMDSKQVFEILMRENAEMLLAFLRASVRDQDAIDDLFQETMLTAWRRLDEFDRDRQFGAWLRGIAANLTLAHYRVQGRQPVPLSQETLDWLETRFSQLHKLRGDTFADKLSALRDCVQSLPDNYRQPIQLRFAESRSLAEVGQTMQLAIETVKKRLSRAKAQLADCLDRKLHSASPIT